MRWVLAIIFCLASVVFEWVWRVDVLQTMMGMFST